MCFVISLGDGNGFCVLPFRLLSTGCNLFETAPDVLLLRFFVTSGCQSRANFGLENTSA